MYGPYHKRLTSVHISCRKHAGDIGLKVFLVCSLNRTPLGSFYSRRVRKIILRSDKSGRDKQQIAF